MLSEMCVLFQVSVLFSIEKAKFWPILAILSQIYVLFGVLLQALKCGVLPKLTNIRHAKRTFKIALHTI